MKIAVCIRRVPDTETRVKIASDGKSPNPEGVNYVLNPYDEYAVEEALRIKERSGEGEVIVVSMGDESVKETIRTALAMGADRAIWVKAENIQGDAYATSVALASVLKEIDFDILFFGHLAVDVQEVQVGARVAEILGIPCVSVITKIEVSDGKATVSRQIEGGQEVFEVSLPAAFTAQKGLNEARYASLKGIMAAKKKEILEKEVPIPDPKITIARMEYPPERPAGRVVGEGVEAVPELIRLLHEEAKVI